MPSICSDMDEAADELLVDASVADKEAVVVVVVVVVAVVVGVAVAAAAVSAAVFACGIETQWVP